MKTELTPENLTAFRERFGTFHDGVIHSVEFGIFSTKKPKLITIRIGTRDLQIQREDNWLNLTFYVEKVHELYLQKSRDSSHGIIFNLSIEFFEKEVYMDFFPRTMEPKGPEDYIKSSTGSLLIIIGKQLFWSLELYQEREI